MPSFRGEHRCINGCEPAAMSVHAHLGLGILHRTEVHALGTDRHPQQLT